MKPATSTLLIAICYLPLLLVSACSTTRKTVSQTPDYLQNVENVLIAEGKENSLFGPCEPTIAINPQNTRQVAAGAILDRYYWSEDAGKTWKSDEIKTSFGVYGDPVLVADWNNNFYYAHLSDPENKGWSSPKLLDRIVVQKSTDGGKTYDNGAYVGFRHPKDQDKHWLAADPVTGHLLCSWTEFDKYNSRETEKDHSRILFAKSVDNGKTWSEDVVINQFEGDCLDDDMTTEGAVPAFGPKGEIYVAWAWNEKIYFDRSMDGGKTWLKQDIIAAEQPTGWAYDIPGLTRCNGLPVLVCDLSNGPNRGTLYLNWSDQRAGSDDTDVFVCKSADGGNTWTTPVRVNDDKKGRHQFLSWLAVDQVTGYLYTVFYDRRNYNDERTDVFLAVSRDGGNTWANAKISKEPFDPISLIFFGDYNNISAHNGVVRPIWTRLHEGILSVWTALIDVK